MNLFSYIRFRLRPPGKLPPPQNTVDVYIDQDSGQLIREESDGTKSPFAGGVTEQQLEDGLALKFDKTGGQIDGSLSVTERVSLNGTGLQTPSLMPSIGVPLGTIVLWKNGNSICFSILELGGGGESEIVPFLVFPPDWDEVTNPRYWRLMDMSAWQMNGNDIRLTYLGTGETSAVYPYPGFGGELTLPGSNGAPLVLGQSYEGKILGPFTNDAAADAGGVQLGEPYYKADGSTWVRQT